MINITDKKECCGCEACVQCCPKHCIQMILDDELFYYPIVDTSSCINCGLCEKICPQIHTQPNKKPLKVYAAKNLNEEERMHSSSGGVFITIAHHFIKKGGIVFGVTYDSDWNVHFSSAETIEEVKAMMGSKYVQAQVGDTYQKAEKQLKTGREVLFTGTPCHIAGLKNYLRKDYENLFTLDILCAGVPSPGVWHKYLQEDILTNSTKIIGEKKSISIPKSFLTIKSIEFRDKSARGREKFSFVVRRKSVSKTDNDIVLSDMHVNNPFMQGFLSSVYKRRSCHDCKFRRGESHSDITIADFWGIKQLMPNFADDKGVSLVLIGTSKGINLFKSLPLDAVESNYETVKPLNGGFNRTIKMHHKRSIFYTALQQGESFDNALQATLHLSPIEKFQKFSKRVLRKLLHILGLTNNFLYKSLIN